MTDPEPAASVAGKWLAAAFPQRPAAVRAARDAGGGSGCRVVFTTAAIAGRLRDLVVKVYAPGFDDYSALGPVATARKHLRALEVLPRLGIPTASLAGFAADGESAAVITWAIVAGRGPVDRARAAVHLAHLHAVTRDALGAELAGLVDRSRPNEGRIRRGVAEMSFRLDRERPDWRARFRRVALLSDGLLEDGEPAPVRRVLQHGDYFTVNLAAGGGTERILDWDLAAWGDPMWDLAHLLAADPRSLRSDDGAVRSTYMRSGGVIDEGLLGDRLGCWRAFWELRRVLAG